MKYNVKYTNALLVHFDEWCNPVETEVKFPKHITKEQVERKCKGSKCKYLGHCEVKVDIPMDELLKYEIKETESTETIEN